MNIRFIKKQATKIWHLKPTKRNYNIVKEVTLIWGQFNYIVDLYVAYLFGSEQWPLATIILSIDLVLSYIDNRFYYWVQEQMGKKKVEHGKRLNKKNGN